MQCGISSHHAAENVINDNHKLRSCWHVQALFWFKLLATTAFWELFLLFFFLAYLFHLLLWYSSLFDFFLIPQNLPNFFWRFIIYAQSWLLMLPCSILSSVTLELAIFFTYVFSVSITVTTICHCCESSRSVCSIKWRTLYFTETLFPGQMVGNKGPIFHPSICPIISMVYTYNWMTFKVMSTSGLSSNLQMNTDTTPLMSQIYLHFIHNISLSHQILPIPVIQFH